MRDRAPWEAVLAAAMAKDDPELTALEQVKAAQDFASNSRHLLTLSEAFWWKFTVPEIDQAVRERIGEREFARYMHDPERPALLQALRAHEIGGRRVEDSLDAITGRTLDGARSIAAVLHGRLEKEPAPARGQTRTWTERTPQDAPEQAVEAARMLDARQAELGRQLAARPPEWALQAWGVPPAEAGALRDDWERRAAIVESYRESAGITDPAQAIGPVPANQAQLREAFHASVMALELPDDQALLRAMGRGQLEAQVSTYERAEALAPRDVSAELAAADRLYKSNLARAQAAREADRNAEADTAEILAGMTADELAGLRVADAARREWAEAHASEAAEARAAEGELRRRDQAERVAQADETAQEQPVETDAEFYSRLDQMVAEAEGREWVRPEPEAEPEPQPEALSEAEFHARLDRMVAAAEARAAAAKAAAESEAGPEPQAGPERAAKPVPAGDAGADQERQAEADAQRETEHAAAAEPVSPERERFLDDMAEIEDAVDAVDAKVEQMPDRDAERRAKVEEAGINEPVMHEPQAEPELEAAWQPGTDSGHDEAAAAAEAEIEM